jgi:ABC-type multidrug transport system ATPase subunit
MSPIVEIECLTRRFGVFTAVDSLTITANAGEVFGLLGSNGAGKSTTIKMLTTLCIPKFLKAIRYLSNLPSGMSSCVVRARMKRSNR